MMGEIDGGTSDQEEPLDDFKLPPEQTIIFTLTLVVCP